MSNYNYNGGNKFYATATNKDGASFIVKVNSELRISALNEAKVVCKKNGLKFEGLHLVKRTEKRGDTLTKYYKGRKQSQQKRK